MIVEAAGNSLSTTSSTNDTEADGLFVDSGKKYVQTWIEINCQKGHHYAKLSTIRNGKKTRKIEDGGHIGTLADARARGRSGELRVSAFISKHYPNCHYVQTFEKDLEKFGLSHLAPASIPAGWLNRRVAGSGRNESQERNDYSDPTQREEVQSHKNIPGD